MNAEQKALLTTARQANDRGHSHLALAALIELVAIALKETEAERIASQLPETEVAQG